VTMQFRQVESTHAYRSIIDQVCDAILRGDLRNGDRLPSERELAEQTGLSRSSVRQAMEVLSAANMIKVKPGGGGGAQIINELVPSELLGQVMATSDKHMLDVFEVRNVLELGAAQLAVSRATEAQIAELESIVDKTERLVLDHPDDKENWVQLDIAFHHAIIRMAGNDFLMRTYTAIFRQLLQVSDMASMAEFAGYGPRSMRLFVTALRRRDPFGVQMAVYAHVYPAGSILLRYHNTETTAAQPDPKLNSESTSPPL
jgi:GntR family transcriptional repressor for pyruvate dehydrogenase complex